MNDMAHNQHNPTTAQEELFDITLRAGRSIARSISTNLVATKAWLTKQYDGKAPSYAQFWSDRDALKTLATARGLADDQWMRKTYNMAVKELFGELPVSTTVEAVSKRAVRLSTARPAAPRRRHTPGRADKPMPAKVEMPKDAESAIRQMLAHFGMAQVLLAFSSILAEYRATAREAQRVKGLGDKMLANPALARSQEIVPPKSATH